MTGGHTLVVVDGNQLQTRCVWSNSSRRLASTLPRLLMKLMHVCVYTAELSGWERTDDPVCVDSDEA